MSQYKLTGYVLHICRLLDGAYPKIAPCIVIDEQQGEKPRRQESKKTFDKQLPQAPQITHTHTLSHTLVLSTFCNQNGPIVHIHLKSRT